MNGRRDAVERARASRGPSRASFFFCSIPVFLVANEPPQWSSGLPRRMRGGILKHFSMGSEGQYNLHFRVEYCNLFNRHTYNINGCCANQSQSGAGNSAKSLVLTTTQGQGNFAVRCTF